MICLSAGMNKINNELVRTQNELMLPFLDNFELFAVCDFIPRIEHREKLQSISIPAMVYEKVAASRFRTRMPRIAQIFADIVDRYASLFNSSNNKPQRSQSTQSRMGTLCALRVLCDGLTLFTSWITRIYTYLRASASSAQSASHRRLSAFICVHLRLIYLSLRERIQKIQFELFTMMKNLPIISCFAGQNIIESALRGEL